MRKDKRREESCSIVLSICESERGYEMETAAPSDRDSRR